MKKLVLFLQDQQGEPNQGLSSKSLVNAVIMQQVSSREQSSHLLPASEAPELIYAQSLEQLCEHLSKDIQELNIRTTVIIPGENILKCDLKVPVKQSRQIQKALPYLVEDQIASDPEDCFIAVGERKEELLSCAIIEKAIIAQHYKTCLDKQLYAEKIISDDSLFVANEASLHVFDNRVLMNTGEGSTFAFDISLLDIYLGKLKSQENVLLNESVIKEDLEESDQITSADVSESAFKKEILTVDIYKSELQQGDELKAKVMSVLDTYKKTHGFEYDVHYVEKSLDDYFLGAADLAIDRDKTGRAINFLQGEYKAKRITSTFKLDVNWKPVAWLAVAFLALYLISVFVDTKRYEKSAEEADLKTKMLFEEIFPKTKNFSRMKDRVSSLIKGSAAPSDNQFLKLVYLFSEAMQSINSSKVNSLDPTQIQYEQSSAELKIDINALDFDTLNTLKEKAEALGLSLEISSTSTEKNGVKARLKVKLKP